MINQADFAAIAAIDLDRIKTKLCHQEGGAGWTRARADAVEIEYRRFLYLAKAYPAEQAIPNVEVDIFWHYHILDTIKYAADCAATFGYFLHHDPSVGMHGPDDVLAWSNNAARTEALYRATFGAADEAVSSVRAPVAAYCGATRPAIAWCGAATPINAAAWCGIATADKAAAWCGIATTVKADAWCGIATSEKAAAWCGIATSEKAAAWCGAATTVKAAAWCGIATAEKAAAWCGVATAEKAAAWCGAATSDKAAAWCGMATSVQALPAVEALAA